MVMNKTEMRSLKVKTVLEMLATKFNAEIEDNGDGGRMDVMIDGFRGQFSRRDLDVALWDSISLHGPGFSKAELDRREQAVELENAINAEIKSTIDQLDAQLMLA
jgi:hypothetical protein